VLSTDERHQAGEQFEAGNSVQLAARSMVVLREL